MLLSSLKDAAWTPYQLQRVGDETGTVTLQKVADPGEKPLFVEVGWTVLRKAGDKAKLVRNPKQQIMTNFFVEPEVPNLSLEAFVDGIQWQTFVAKTLPVEVQRDMGIIV